MRRDGFYDHEDKEPVSRKEMRTLIAESTRDRQGRSLTWRELGLLCGVMCPLGRIVKAMKVKGYAKCRARPSPSTETTGPE